jgi:hypothetical protein
LKEPFCRSSSIAARSTLRGFCCRSSSTRAWRAWKRASASDMSG